MQAVASARLRGVTLVLDNLYQQHNMSAVLRSAEAFGIDTVHVIEDRNRFHINRAITHGCHKWLTVVRHDRPEDCLLPLKEQGWKLWAALPAPEAIPIRKIPLTPAIALVFGNEGDGVSETTLRLCDAAFTIPMFGFSESLNVSVAAAVALENLTRRYRAWIGRPGDLSPQERAALLARWSAGEIPDPFTDDGPTGEGGTPGSP